MKSDDIGIGMFGNPEDFVRDSVLTLIVVLVSFAPFAFAEDQPHDHVTIDIKRANWEPMVLATSTTIPEPPADNVSIDLSKDNPVFTSHEPGANGVFEYRLHVPVDSARYPFMVVKYRAKNLNATHERPGIWLDDTAGKGATKPIIALKDFTADGEEHEIRKDLREVQPPPRAAIGRFLLGIMASDQGDALVELLSLEFQADPTAQLQEFKEDSALTITVMDKENQPIKGTKVTIDAERKDFAKSGETDDKGDVSITPRETETGAHSVQVEAEGMATYFATIAKGAPGANANMVHGVTYGGIVKNEDGQPIEGATVRIFAPPPPKAPSPIESRMIRRAVMKTDAEGKWKSPVLPEGDVQVITKLAHPNYIADKEYRGAQDEPSADEMKAGTGVMVLKK